MGYNITNATTRQFSIQFLCGSTLITQRHVMSAAHCVLPTLVTVRLGAYDITQTPDGYNTIDANVIAVFVHEQYDSRRITNDISIVKLAQILPMTSYIRPGKIRITFLLKQF
jgi:secreted trypsin-like serine protease